MKIEGFKYYLRGTFILLIIFSLILLSCFGIIVGPEKQRVVFYIVFFSICGIILLAYWIYGFIRYYKKKKGKSKYCKIEENKNGK